MAALRGLLYCKVKIFILLSVLPFLVVSEMDSPSTFGGNDILDGHLTGHVQMRKDSVPTEILPCLTQPASTAASDCPNKHSQWNNMHCHNDSFGMYTNEKRFVNFGAGPLGVVFPTSFFNPLVSYSGYSSGSSDSNEKTQKIEALLKENAEASMNVTLLGQMLQKLQREKEELKQELSNMKQTNAEQKGVINILRLRAFRLEEGHQDCTASNIIQRNTSSIALRAAQNHITQLKIENKLFMEANKECSSELVSVRELLANVQNQGEEKELELARCSVSLTSIQGSEAAIRKALSEEEEEHNNYINKCQEEHKLVTSEKQDAQVAYASCEASRKEITNVHEQMNQDYDKCLEGVGRTNVRLDLCRGALNSCRGNHSMAANAGEICEQDRVLCLDKASRLKQSLTVCEKNVKVSHESLNSVKANKKELTSRIVSIQSEFRDVKLSEDELRIAVKTLTAKLDEERNAFSDADAKARMCSLDLVTARTSFETSRDRVGVVSEQLGELRHRYTSLTKEKYRLEAKLSVTMEKYMFLKSNHKKCQGMLNDESLSSERLVQTEAECHKKLSNVTTSLSVIELQRNKCLERHHINVKQTDEWRARYEYIDRQLTTSHLNHVNCTGKLNLLNNRFNALQEEADEMQTLNANLNDRLKTTLEAMASTTNSNTNLRETISIKIQDKIDLGKQLSELEVKLEAEKKNYSNCLDKYDESKARVVTLEEKVSESTNASARLQEHLDHCSEELEEKQATLEVQHDHYDEQQQLLRSEQNALQVAKGLHSGAQVQVETLQRQLGLCRGNHTELNSEAVAREQQLIQCQKKITEEKADSLQRVEQVQERYEGCQSNLRHAGESFSVTVLANTHCQSEKKAETERADGLNRAQQRSVLRIKRSMRRTKRLDDLVNQLQGDSRTFKMRLESANRQYRHTRDQLLRCRETREKKEQELFEASGELEECLHSAHIMAGEVWGTTCPKTKQGTYVSSTSDCLLVTRSIGSQEEMERLCRQQAGGRLLTKASASTRELQADVTRVLAGRHLPPAAIWLDAPRTRSPLLRAIDGHRCYGLNVNSTGGHLTTQRRECGDQLPGLCVTGHQVDTSGAQAGDTSYSFDTSSVDTSWSISNDTISGSANLGGDLDFNSLLSSGFNQSFLEQFDL